jgi:type VI secretion system secreted protein VgrG
MVAQRNLTISGSFAEGALLVEGLHGREDLGDPFQLTLSLLSESPDIDISGLVGDTMTVAVDIDEGLTRYFNGYVTRMALVGTFDKYARYQATLRPWFWLMSSRINSRVFQNKSVPDIAKDLFREHGFSDFEDALSGSYPEREFVVQYRESDFAFVSRLFEHAGIYYFFRHEDGRHVLVLADSSTAHETAPGYDEVTFHPEGAPTPSAEECVNRWELVHQWRPGAYASEDFDFERPKADLTARLSAEVRHKKGDLEVYDYPGGYLTTDEGESYVRGRLEALQSEVELAHGAGDLRGPGAGSLFKLINHPTESQNKQYLILSASYDAKNNPHDTGADDESGYFRFSFSALDSEVPFRPPLATPRSRVEGVQTAIVVGPDGEEIWTDKYGRVKVQFHWDREGKDDEQSSCWVRVAQVWAGSGWGGMHIPRIGQEVIVDFLEGDPDRPIVTGRVYNADNMPPYALPENQTQSGIKSHSTKGGGLNNFNELRFEDKKGAEEVYVQAEKDLDALVKNDETRSVGHDRTTDIKNDETITVGDNRTESVAKDETISIGNNRTESVKKAETVSIGTTRTHSVGTDETLSVGGARTASVGKDESISVGANQVVSIAKNLSLDVGGSRTLTIGKDDTINVDGKLTVSVVKDEAREVGKTLTINAADSITLVSGDASIMLQKNGNITIKGKDITVDASGKLNLKAGGDITVKGSKVSQN